MSTRSLFTPVQSSFAALLWATLTVAFVLPIALSIFMQILPPAVWHPWADTWYSLSLHSGAQILREQGYAPPSGVLGWLAAPNIYLWRVWPVLVSPEALMPALIHFAAVLFVTSGSAAVVFRRIRAIQPKLLVAGHVAGPQPHWGKAGLAHLSAAYADSLRQTGAGVMLAPGLRLPRQSETEGLFLVGRPGSGKSVILEGVMAQALKRGDRVLALDVKGNLAHRLGDYQPRVLSLNGREASVWAIGRDLRTPDDADEFAACLIPESRDPVWSQGSRLILSALVQHLRAKHGAGWGWRELHDLLSLPIASLEPLIAAHAPLMAQLLQGREEPANFVLSLIMNLAAHVSASTARFAAMERKGALSLSLRDWARGKAGSAPIVMRFDLQRRDQSGAFVRLTLRILSGVLLGDDVCDGVDHRLWLFLDEVTRAGRADPVADLAALGRARGVRCVVTAQSPAQLVEVYGPAGAEALLENFGTQIICRLTQGETARRVSRDWIGTRILREPTSAVRPGQTPEQRTVEVLSPQDIAGELGLRYDLLGRPLIRAAVLGSGDVAVLDWPLRLWSKLA